AGDPRVIVLPTLLLHLHFFGSTAERSKTIASSSDTTTSLPSAESDKYELPSGTLKRCVDLPVEMSQTATCPVFSSVEHETSTFPFASNTRLPSITGFRSVLNERSSLPVSTSHTLMTSLSAPARSLLFGANTTDPTLRLRAGGVTCKVVGSAFAR